MTTRDSRSAKQVTRKALPLQKAHVHDTAVNANTDFLGADITPSDPPCLFRIEICLDTAAVFKVMVETSGGTTVPLEMNSGAQLVAQSAYFFDVLVHEDDSVNFQCDQNAQIEKFLVQEIVWGTQ